MSTLSNRGSLKAKKGAGTRTEGTEVKGIINPPRHPEPQDSKVLKTSADPLPVDAGNSHGLLSPDAGPRNPGPDFHTGADGIPHSHRQADSENRRCDNCNAGQPSQS